MDRLKLVTEGDSDDLSVRESRLKGSLKETVIGLLEKELRDHDVLIIGSQSQQMPYGLGKSTRIADALLAQQLSGKFSYRAGESVTNRATSRTSEEFTITLVISPTAEHAEVTADKVVRNRSERNQANSSLITEMNSVGFHTEFSQRVAAHNMRLLFVTPNIFFNLLAVDPLLSQVTNLVIDEVLNPTQLRTDRIPITDSTDDTPV